MTTALVAIGTGHAAVLAKRAPRRLSSAPQVLERATKAERIRTVTELLRRFQALFGMPARIKVSGS